MEEGWLVYRLNKCLFLYRVAPGCCADLWTFIIMYVHVVRKITDSGLSQVVTEVDQLFPI